MGVSLRAVSALLFGSGFAALVYQTAWQRTFRLTFGASTGASAAVLALFLGGMGLGGLLLARRIERSPRPLLVYGNLELGIALLAAVSPLLSELMHQFYLALGGSVRLGTAGATCVRLLCASVVIGPAAVLMGGTLPAVARHITTEHDPGRHRLALLYALNTVGAVVGALVGPLFLFGLLGTKYTLWFAVCVNLLIAVFARSWGRSCPPLPTSSAPQAQPSIPAELSPQTGPSPQAELPSPQAEPPSYLAHTPSSPVPPEPRLAAPFIYAIAALVGFVFLALELVWYRMLAPILGGSTITFGLILATALAGIGTGGYLYSRRSAARPVSLGLLATTLALEGVCVLLPFAWGDDLALIVVQLRQFATLGYAHLLFTWLVVTTWVVFPAAVVSGYQFPLLFALLGQGRAQVAVHVGTTYAFNTAGTIVGSLLAGFVLLPSWGAVLTWRLLGGALLLLAAICALLEFRQHKRAPQWVASFALLLGCALAFTAGPGAVWRHTPIGAGRVDFHDLSPNQVEAWKRETRSAIVWERDGVESSVGLSIRNDMAFLVNGKSDGSVSGDRATQVFLGLLPAALHGQAREAFVVGLGTGMTAGLLAEAPGVEHVQVAELEHAVTEIARRASSVNGQVLDNPRVEILWGDGRELLLTSRKQYDLIISEPSNPYRAGIASLFTREFYEAADSKLREGGLFAQWIQGYEIDARALSIAITTLREVFPYVSIWGPQGSDLILMGSHHPQEIDVPALAERVSHPHYLKWMRRAWNMEGALGVLAHHISPPSQTEYLMDRLPVEVNTDDLNSLEFAFARRVGENTYNALTDLFRALQGREVRPTVRGELDWQRWEDLRHRIQWPGYAAQNPSLLAQATVLGCDNQMVEAESTWPEDEPPQDLTETFIYALLVAQRLDEDALAPLLERLEKEGFSAEAHYTRALLADAGGDPKQAERELALTFAALRKEPFPLCDLNSRAIRHARYLGRRAPTTIPGLLQALEGEPFLTHLSDAERLLALFHLAVQTKDPASCAHYLGRHREHPIWQLEHLTLRASCLREAKDPDADAALADLADYFAREPATFSDSLTSRLLHSSWNKPQPTPAATQTLPPQNIPAQPTPSASEEPETEAQSDETAEPQSP